ncbi:MAG: hypothetical protein NC548_26460 [Lachnospiraceae bacterium]|nr:hypothetical protein [Lachnospiraceae bacterium]
MARYRVKYNDQNTCIDIKGYMVSGGLVCLSYPAAEENSSGFVIYDAEGGVIADCTDFKYRWDVLEDNPDKIYYTDQENNVQEKKFGNGDMAEDTDPLNNEELTECVADLMYQISLNQLGL